MSIFRYKCLLASVAMIAGCGNVGSSDETVSLVPAGLDVTVTVPTGGKIEKSPLTGEAMINWKGLSWHATLRLSESLSESNRPLGPGEHGEFEARTPVVIKGKAYTCWVTAKTEPEAKRVQPTCDALAKASPKIVAQPTAVPAIELEDKVVPKIGSKIKIPKGAKTLDENEYTATYSLRLPDGLNELNVSVNKAGAASLEDAKRSATMIGGSVADAKALPGGMFEVVLAPELRVQTVSISSAHYGAKCAGPTSYLPKLIEMCESLVPPDAAQGAKAATGHDAHAKKPAVTAGKATPKRK